MRTLARSLAILIALLAAIAAARAAEINAFVSTAIKTVTDELLPPFERANGHTIRASYAPSGALIPRLAPGGADLARTGIGIAVRKGAPRPDVSSAEALRRALIAAKTVGYAAPSGGSITAAHIMSVFERLGIAAEVAPKARPAAGG